MPGYSAYLDRPRSRGHRQGSPWSAIHTFQPVEQLRECFVFRLQSQAVTSGAISDEGGEKGSGNAGRVGMVSRSGPLEVGPAERSYLDCLTMLHVHVQQIGKDDSFPLDEDHSCLSARWWLPVSRFGRDTVLQAARSTCTSYLFSMTGTTQGCSLLHSTLVTLQRLLPRASLVIGASRLMTNGRYSYLWICSMRLPAACGALVVALSKDGHWPDDR